MKRSAAGEASGNVLKLAVTLLRCAARAADFDGKPPKKKKKKEGKRS